VSTILIGVDASERSQDAVAFGRYLAAATGADLILANVYAPPDFEDPGAARDAARALVRRLLDGGAGATRIIADPSPARALQELAHSTRAALTIVGSSHTGRVGRVLPGSTGEHLLHGSPCAVAVVPKGYREQPGHALRRIGVAYNGSDGARAALAAAVALARALPAELEIIGVAASEAYMTPALIGAAGSTPTLREDIQREVRERLDEVVAALPDDIAARSVLLTGDTEGVLTGHSEQLDLLVTGSRGFGPLHSVLVGGLSGRLVRSAHCPVIVVPRGTSARLDALCAREAVAG
jgi:nucleotide-binding universal stress UspA family protein